VKSPCISHFAARTNVTRSCAMPMSSTSMRGQAGQDEGKRSYASHRERALIDDLAWGDAPAGPSVGITIGVGRRRRDRHRLLRRKGGDRIVASDPSNIGRAASIRENLINIVHGS
jgi:hypothetical protein